LGKLVDALESFTTCPYKEGTERVMVP